MNLPFGTARHTQTSSSSEPIVTGDERGFLIQKEEQEMSVRNAGKSKRSPMAVRLFTQFEDGTTREWDHMDQIGKLVQVLHGVMRPSNGGNRGSLRVPACNDPADFAVPHCTETMTEATAQASISFFWIDITGTPMPQDLELLFGLLNVNAFTRHKWRSEVADLLPRETWNSSSSEETAVCVEKSDLDPSSESGEKVMDQLHAFLEEEYIQLQLAAIPTACTETTATRVGAVVQPSPIPPGEGGRDHQPDRLHSNLFDVGDVDDLSCVQLLCFPDGIVTWRPRPELEGWTYIARDFKRHLGKTSSPQKMITTSLLLYTILAGLFEAFLPDPASVLNEVDAIDAMLPLLRQQESEQADVLRRALLLRQGISVHRRLLFGKVNLLQQLDRRLTRTILGSFAFDWNNASGVPQSPNDCALITQDVKDIRLFSSNSGPGNAAIFQGQNYTSISRRILHLLQQLDGARMVLGNATIIYTSGVAVHNNTNSNESDYRMVVLQYVLMIVLPLTIVASHWGMNCFVPWQDVDSTGPFWGLASVMGAYSVLFLSYPVYCWATNRPDKLVF